MVNLVIDSRMINMSGIGTYLKNIIPNLIESEKFFITCMGYQELKSFEWFEKIAFIELNSKILSIDEQFELFFKIPKCDIFWSPNWNVPLLPIKARERVVTIHDVYHLANSMKFSKAKILVVKLYMQFIKFYYRKIITVSNFSKYEIAKHTGIELNYIKMIPLAVADDFNIFDKQDINTNQFILYVGNVKPHKNLLFSLRAFASIKDKDIKFVIVGKRDGFITNDIELQNYLQNLTDRVVFTDVISDDLLKSYYQKATIFLFPSRYEGFGLPILEAMKFKLPIICSESAALPEVGGDCIIYFNPYDLTDLIDKLNGILSNEIKIDTGKYQEQLSKFSWFKTSTDHVQFFNREK